MQNKGKLTIMKYFRACAGSFLVYLIVDEPCVAVTQLNSDLAKIHMLAERWPVKFNPTKSEAIVI